MRNNSDSQSTKNDGMVTWTGTGGFSEISRQFSNLFDGQTTTYWEAKAQTCPNCDENTIKASFKEKL